MSKNYKIEKNFYDDEYIARYLSVPDERVSRLIDLMDINSNDVVADYACGNGILADLIHDKVREYFGVDYSDKFIELAKSRRYENVNFVCQDIMDFSAIHDNFFDVACAFDFSEHITDNEFTLFFSAMYSSLKDKGKLYLHTPNGRYFLELMKKSGILRQIPGHIEVRSAIEYVHLLEKAGFSRITIQRLPHYLAPMSWIHPLSHLPIVGDLFAARLFICCVK